MSLIGYLVYVPDLKMLDVLLQCQEVASATNE